MLARKYRLLEPLGEGGMAVVWVAQNVALETKVAVKILRAGLVSDPRVVARFRQEAKATARIAHKNIVQVYDYGITNWGAPFIVMELLQGETLAQRLKKRGPLPPEEAARILLRAMKGITIAHTKGIIHRDLKPENIFLVKEENGIERPKVLDFGVSLVLRSGGDDRLTKAGGLVGTPSYLPPEVIDGDARGDAQGDVWALGVILYEAVCGRLPFQGKTVHALLEAICRTEPAPVAEFAPSADAGLQVIVERALAKNLAERYQGVREFFDDLNNWLGRRELQMTAPLPAASQALKAASPMMLSSDPMTDDEGPTLIGPALESMNGVKLSDSRPSRSPLPRRAVEAAPTRNPTSDRISLTPSSRGPQSRTLAPASGRRWRSVALWFGAALAAGVAVVVLVVSARYLRGKSEGGRLSAPSVSVPLPASSSAPPPVPPASSGVPSSSAAAAASSSPSAAVAASGGVEVLSASEATLDIVGLPEQALVRIDGRRVEQFPLVIRRGLTVHLRVDAPGYEPWLQDVEIEGSVRLRYAGRSVFARPSGGKSPGGQYKNVPY